MESNKIFEELQKRGYVVHNKRVLGNPLHTSEETKVKDLTQEFALVVEWLRINHGIYVQTMLYRRNPNDYVGGVYFNKVDTHYTKPFYTPQEAYSAAFDYVLSNLI